MTEGYDIETIGRRYIRVTFQEPSSHELTMKLIALGKALMDMPGVLEATYGYRTLLVRSEADLEELADPLHAAIESADGVDFSEHQVDVAYDGPDLEWTSEYLQISTDELVRRHTAEPYHVVALGSPGFIYLSLLSPQMTVPRLATPRPDVPGGSVGLAGRQTGIYGVSRPGGWRVIGRCVAAPVVKPGDVVRFASA